ncbi:MAG: hypothetical protein AAB592_03380 [Patescibacteria group bacterium]
MIHDSGFYEDGQHDHDRDPLSDSETAVIELQLALIGFLTNRVLNAYNGSVSQDQRIQVENAIGGFLIDTKGTGMLFRETCCGFDDDVSPEAIAAMTDEERRVATLRIKPRLYEKLKAMDGIGRADEVLSRMGYKGGVDTFVHRFSPQIHGVLLAAGIVRSEVVAKARRAASGAAWRVYRNNKRG